MQALTQTLSTLQIQVNNQNHSQGRGDGRRNKDADEEVENIVEAEEADEAMAPAHHQDFAGPMMEIVPTILAPSANT